MVAQSTKVLSNEQKTNEQQHDKSKTTPKWLGRQVSAAYQEHASLIESLQKKLKHAETREKFLVSRLESQKYNVMQADSGINDMYNADLIRPTPYKNNTSSRTVAVIEDAPNDESNATRPKVYSRGRRSPVGNPSPRASADEEELPMDEMAAVAREVQSQQNNQLMQTTREEMERLFNEERSKNKKAIEEYKLALKKKDQELKNLREMQLKKPDQLTSTFYAYTKGLAGMPCHVNVNDYNDTKQLESAANNTKTETVHKIPDDSKKDTSEKDLSKEHEVLIKKLTKALDWMLLSADNNSKTEKEKKQHETALKKMKLTAEERVLVDKVHSSFLKSRNTLNLTNMLYKEKIDKLQAKVKEQEDQLIKSEDEQKVKKERIAQLETECRKLRVMGKRRPTSKETSPSPKESKEIQLLKEQLADAQAKLQTQAKHYEKEMEVLEMDLHAKDEECKRLQEEKDTTEKEHTTAVDSFRRVMNDTIVGKDETIEELQDEITVLNVQLDDLHQQLKSLKPVNNSFRPPGRSVLPVSR